MNSSKTIPDITPIAYNIPIMLTFSLMFLLVLKSTNNPTPAFTATPEISTGIEITFEINNSVNITDDAQLGTRPIKPAIIGPSITFLLIKCAIVSSPIYVIIPFRISVITNMNIVIFNVCFVAEETIPTSQ